MAWHDMQKQLEKNRRPEDVLAARHANHTATVVQQIAALFEPKGFFPGESSLGAARRDEVTRMKAFFAALDQFRSVAREAQKGTEIPAIDKGIGEFLGVIEDALHDAGVTEAAWAAAVEEMR